jgi:hypothetical protein
MFVGSAICGAGGGSAAAHKIWNQPSGEGMLLCIDMAGLL